MLLNVLTSMMLLLAIHSRAIETSHKPKSRERLIILPYTESNTYPKDLQESILAVLSTEATALGRFEIVDRNNLNSLLQEHATQLSATTLAKDLIELGAIAATEKGLLLRITRFSQVGQPSEDQGLFEQLVRIALLRGEAYSNNIETQLSIQLQKIDLKTGQTLKSKDFTWEHTGGTKSASLSTVKNNAKKSIRTFLKTLYLLEAHIADIDEKRVLLPLGNHLGIRQGQMFHVINSSTPKVVLGDTIVFAGKKIALVSIQEVTEHYSYAKIIRQWQPLEKGMVLKEHTKAIRGLNFAAYALANNARGGEFLFEASPLRAFSISFGLGMGTLYWEQRIVNPGNTQQNIPASETLINGHAFEMQIPMYLTYHLRIHQRFALRPQTGFITGFGFRKDNAQNNVSAAYIAIPTSLGMQIQLNSHLNILIDGGMRFLGRSNHWTLNNSKEESSVENAIWNSYGIAQAAPRVFGSGPFVKIGLQWLLF
jgi:hypothetical protein